MWIKSGRFSRPFIFYHHHHYYYCSAIHNKTGLPSWNSCRYSSSVWLPKLEELRKQWKVCNAFNLRQQYPGTNFNLRISVSSQGHWKQNSWTAGRPAADHQASSSSSLSRVVTSCCLSVFWDPVWPQQVLRRPSAAAENHWEPAASPRRLLSGPSPAQGRVLKRETLYSQYQKVVRVRQQNQHNAVLAFN